MNAEQRLVQEVEQPLDKLLDKYPLFSQENDFICSVGHWIRQAVEGHLPTQNLTLADALVDNYKSIHKKSPFIGELKEIIDMAYEGLTALGISS